MSMIQRSDPFRIEMIKDKTSLVHQSKTKVRKKPEVPSPIYRDFGLSWLTKPGSRNAIGNHLEKDHVIKQEQGISILELPWQEPYIRSVILNVRREV